MIARILIMLMFVSGMAALVIKRNIIKKTYALAVINSAVILLFIFEGSRIGGAAPLLDTKAEFVDPIPQALMLTAIVVGVCVSALALAIAWRLYKEYGTLDIDELKKRIGHE